MNAPENLSPAQAQELLAQAESVGRSATKSAAWPTAMIFSNLGILGSLLMVGMHIVAHTGYGAALLAMTIGGWAAVVAILAAFLPSSTKIGYTKRFVTSLALYFVLYGVGLVLGTLFFPHGNLAYYISAAVVVGLIGIAAAVREIRA